MLAFHSFILVKRCAVKTIPSFKKPSYWIFYIRIEHCQFEVKPTVPSEVFLDLDDNFEKYTKLSSCPCVNSLCRIHRYAVVRELLLTPSERSPAEVEIAE